MGEARMHGPVTSELARELARREVAPTALMDALDDTLGAGEARRELSSTWRVTRAWHEVNGDVERRATASVFLDRRRRPGARPVLCVYVDTHARATDFAANREVYLARLARVGLDFEDIKFLVSRRPKADSKDGPCCQLRRSRPLPDLPPSEAAEIERMCSTLPPRLRESVSRAMSASYRRARAEESGNGE